MRRLAGRFVGVTPPEFFGIEIGAAPDIFVPVMMQPTAMPAFENLLDNPIIYRTWLTPFGRLKPGIDRRLDEPSGFASLWK